MVAAEVGATAAVAADVLGPRCPAVGVGWRPGIARWIAGLPDPGFCSWPACRSTASHTCMSPGGSTHDGHDAHTDPVPSPVLTLLAQLPAELPVLLERDGHYPPDAELTAELIAIARARPTPTSRVGAQMRASRGISVRESGRGSARVGAERARVEPRTGPPIGHRERACPARRARRSGPLARPRLPPSRPRRRARGRRPTTTRLRRRSPHRHPTRPAQETGRRRPRPGRCSPPPWVPTGSGRSPLGMTATSPPVLCGTAGMSHARTH